MFCSDSVISFSFAQFDYWLCFLRVSSCGPISKEKYGHDAVVFLSIQAKITLRSVATGQNCMLSPTTQTTTSQSAKYIMLLMNFQNMKILYNHLVRFSLCSHDSIIDYMLYFYYFFIAVLYNVRRFACFY